MNILKSILKASNVHLKLHKSMCFKFNTIVLFTSVLFTNQLLTTSADQGDKECLWLSLTVNYNLNNKKSYRTHSQVLINRHRQWTFLDKSMQKSVSICPREGYEITYTVRQSPHRASASVEVHEWTKPELTEMIEMPSIPEQGRLFYLGHMGNIQEQVSAVGNLK